MQSERSPPLFFHVKHLFILVKGRLFMDYVNIFIFKDASPFGEWHVKVTVNDVPAYHFTSSSFDAVLEYANRYLLHKARKKECL